MDINAIKEYINNKRYSFRSHTVRHMIEEGFEEHHIIEALLSGKVLEEYSDEERKLILGFFNFTSETSCPPHVVVDYSDKDCLNIITAYIPQRPYWVNPSIRGNKK